MKCVYITCNISMLESVRTILNDMKFSDYQVIEQVTAKSSYSSPRLNTAVWPGYNSSLIIQEKDENKVSSLIEKVNEMNNSAFNNTEIIALFVWEITSCSHFGNNDK